ncbi:MAG: alpha/beta hydrolase, partial [Actinomycetota bacterium]|nr:alpha/beta hydrolase [Actinomycetota bacterium]
FEVMTDFLKEFGAHNRYAALAGLQYAKALVLGADGDRLIQYEHSKAIAELLPDAELVQVEGAGHVTMLEQPKLVNEHLLDLLAQCAGALPRSRKGHEYGAGAGDSGGYRAPWPSSGRASASG